MKKRMILGLTILLLPVVTQNTIVLADISNTTSQAINNVTEDTETTSNTEVLPDTTENTSESSDDISTDVSNDVSSDSTYKTNEKTNINENDVETTIETTNRYQATEYYNVDKTEIDDAHFKEVSTEDEYWHAIADITTTYIQLQQDIHLTKNNNKITKDIIIDGKGNTITYESKGSYTSLATAANNLNITFKDINIGSDTNTNNTWYGFITTKNNGTTINISNMNYQGGIGGQPFYSENGGTLNISGVNMFHSEGTTNGGEFVEGYEFVNFKENSQTTVYNDTGSTYALMYARPTMNVTLEQNSVLDIMHTKRDLNYGTVNYTLENESKMTVRAKNGLNSTKSKTIYGTYNANNNSTLEFITDSIELNTNNTVINANNPNAVYMKNEQRNPVITGILNIKRHDMKQDNTYLINYISDNTQQVLNNNIQPGDSVKINNDTIKKGSSLLYTAKPKVITSDISSIVDHKISNVIIHATTNNNNKVEVKTSDNKLHQGNILDATNQAIISQYEDSTTIPTNTTHTLLENVEGHKTKHIYTRANTSKHYSEYVIHSDWIYQVVTQPEFIGIELPTRPLTFEGHIPGAYNMHQQPYIITNTGNIPIYLKPTTLTENKNNMVKLVNELTTHSKQEMTLDINAVTSNSVTQWTSGKPMIDEVKMQPYYTNNSDVNIYLSGGYSGPLITTYDVDYIINFQWRSAR